eukprot:TRINITY_DN149_c1_g2_i4.p1 TRINITY_DN149_c1_g2~~TRINITY_DN149_c1_g2_i4.p1  ORF type:complete len:496 (-),score=133.49 TRINITY_DN149_c1_g2_i4:573-2060(-)
MESCNSEGNGASVCGASILWNRRRISIPTALITSIATAILIVAIFTAVSFFFFFFSFHQLFPILTVSIVASMLRAKDFYPKSSHYVQSRTYRGAKKTPTKSSIVGTTDLNDTEGADTTIEKKEDISTAQKKSAFHKISSERTPSHPSGPAASSSSSSPSSSSSQTRDYVSTPTSHSPSRKGVSRERIPVPKAAFSSYIVSSTVSSPAKNQGKHKRKSSPRKTASHKFEGSSSSPSSSYSSSAKKESVSGIEMDPIDLETADKHTLKKRIRELEVKISEESLKRSEVEVKLHNARNENEEKEVESQGLRTKIVRLQDLRSRTVEQVNRYKESVRDIIESLESQVEAAETGRRAAAQRLAELSDVEERILEKESVIQALFTKMREEQDQRLNAVNRSLEAQRRLIELEESISQLRIAAENGRRKDTSSEKKPGDENETAKSTAVTEEDVHILRKELDIVKQRNESREGTLNVIISEQNSQIEALLERLRLLEAELTK